MFFTTTQQEKPTRRYRMYGLVPYNISPIQQAIQFGHAVVEYANEYFHDHDYQSWSHDDKTFIILNGGTTNTLIERFGTLNNYKLELEIAAVGLDKEEIDIIVDSETLRIAYRKTEDEKQKEQDEYRYLHRSIKKASFDIAWKISSKYELAKLEAKLDKGLLTLDIPFAKENKPKKISIK